MAPEKVFSSDMLHTDWGVDLTSDLGCVSVDTCPGRLKEINLVIEIEREKTPSSDLDSLKPCTGCVTH
jgi:hypothetical protein